MEHAANSGLIRAVVDTSSLVGRSLRRDLQQAAEFGWFVAIWSPWIIAELNRVLTWQWIDHRGASEASRRECSRQARLMMEYLERSFELVAPSPPYPAAWASLQDESDVPVWAAAKTSNAAYVVSENTTDYPPADVEGRFRHEGIEYLPGRQFLDRLNRGEDPSA